VGAGAPNAAGQIMRGFFATPLPPTPEEEITDILDFLDAALTAGSLPQGQAQALEKKLAAAARSIELGKTAKACRQLESAYDRNKKLLKSKDSAVRTPAAELTAQIQDLMKDLKCK
jgi:HPt (histidine-containing phosphotransfer) domain-containing protein